MDDNASRRDSARRLAPITASSNHSHNRLPSFSHLAQVDVTPDRHLRNADTWSQSIPEFRKGAIPALARQGAFSGRPRSHSYASNARPTPLSPLVHRMDIDEPTPPPDERALSTTSSAQRSEGQTSSTPSKGGKHYHRVAPGFHHAPQSAGPSKPAMLSPPISPPSPPLTTSSSEPNLSNYAMSAAGTIAQDHSILPSTMDKDIDEYIAASMVLDLSRAGLVQEAQEELDNLFGRKGDPIQLLLDAHQTRRQELLAEWGQDAKTLLTDKSLERFHMRCMILDIDRQVKLLQLLR